MLTLAISSSSLSDAVKKVQRQNRRTLKSAGIKTLPLDERCLEKERVVEALTGPGPGQKNQTMSARAGEGSALARRKFTRHLSEALCANVTMLSKHTETKRKNERISRQHINIAEMVETLKNKNEEISAHCKAIERTQGIVRHDSCKHQKEKMREHILLTSSRMQKEIQNVSANRERVHWSDHKSGLIPHDPLMAQRKAGATSLQEFQSACAEENSRVLLLRQQRLESLATSKLHTQGESFSASLFHLDGTEHFQIDMPQTSLSSNLKQTSNLDINESSPSMNMLAAQRIFR